MPRTTGRAWRRLRAYVLARDQYQCQRMNPLTGIRCGRPATDAGHILDVALGGTDHPANLRAECAHCNRSAGARLGTRLATYGTR